MLFRYEGHRLRVRAALLVAVAMVACGHRSAPKTVAVAAVPVVSGGPFVADEPRHANVAEHAEPAAASRGTARSGPPPTTTTSTTRPARPAVGGTSTAIASWYEVSAGAGACGRKCSTYAPYTFAHQTMPFGTAVQFCVGQRCVIARCSDRGPYVPGRTFDLSRTVFAALGSTGAGTLTVRWSLA